MEEKMFLPEKVEYLISRLASAGYRADAVGGCVRDSLLGRVPGDYDITTSATPNEMKRVFSDLKTVETGIKHGTLTVILDSEPYEITTYRIDGEYTDNRRPDSVKFTDRLSEDLSRRDFTVNAMCYSHEYGYTDLFGGLKDLEGKLIRAVGDPVRRFNEDALRIMRAIRFSSTLGFEIETGTSDAIFETAHLLKNIAKERIYAEWTKLIGGMGALGVIERYSSVISVAIPEITEINLESKSGFESAKAEIRELMLFASLYGEDSAEHFYSALTSLRCDNKHKDYGYSVLKNYKAKTDDSVSQNILLIKTDLEVARGVIELKIALGLSESQELEILDSLIENGVCYRISDLKINGNDIRSLGLSGKKIGETLEALLYSVAEGKIENCRDELIKEVAKNI